MSISGINSTTNKPAATAFAGAGQSSSVAGNGFAALLAKMQNGLSVTASSSNNSTTNGAFLTAQQTPIAYSPPSSSATTSSDPVIQKFLNYMNETPAEKFEDQWLAAHHLTRDDLKNMTPEKRAAIMKQMQQDMELAIKKKIQQDTGTVA